MYRPCCFGTDVFVRIYPIHLNLVASDAEECKKNREVWLAILWWHFSVVTSNAWTIIFVTQFQKWTWSCYLTVRVGLSTKEHWHWARQSRPSIRIIHPRSLLPKASHHSAEPAIFTIPFVGKHQGLGAKGWFWHVLVMMRLLRLTSVNNRSSPQQSHFECFWLLVDRGLFCPL